MSIFSKPLSALDFADVAALLDDRAVENVRLEFKREIPGKDETLKKLSSFANTFGGLLVIGADADETGRITGLPGVEAQKGYKQTVVQWCASGATPPITAYVSDYIRSGADPNKGYYVVSVPESILAPHFLSGRRGLYVRTDEFSTRFEPRLATEYEIRHLLDRRRLVEERRRELVERARLRFRTFFGSGNRFEEESARRPLPIYLNLAVIPNFPVAQIVEHHELLNLVRNTTVPYRGTGFPRELNLISQHESAIILNPCPSPSILEANVWGMINYGVSIGEARKEFTGIHAPRFIGFVLLFLEHASRLTYALGLSGSVRIDVRLDGVWRVPWVHFPDGFPLQGGDSTLDETVSFDISTTTETLTNARDELASDLLRFVFFAVNWAGTADSPEKVADLLRVGRRFNQWESAAPR